MCPNFYQNSILVLKKFMVPIAVMSGMRRIEMYCVPHTQKMKSPLYTSQFLGNIVLISSTTEKRLCKTILHSGQVGMRRLIKETPENDGIIEICRGDFNSYQWFHCIDLYTKSTDLGDQNFENRSHQNLHIQLQFHKKLAYHSCDMKNVLWFFLQTIWKWVPSLFLKWIQIFWLLPNRTKQKLKIRRASRWTA